MDVSNTYTSRQHDANVALDNLGRLIARLDSATLASVLQARSSEDLEALRLALATLAEMMERETIKREDAGLSQHERGR